MAETVAAASHVPVALSVSRPLGYSTAGWPLNDLLRDAVETHDRTAVPWIIREVYHGARRWGFEPSNVLDTRNPDHTWIDPEAAKRLPR